MSDKKNKLAEVTLIAFQLSWICFSGIYLLCQHTNTKDNMIIIARKKFQWVVAHHRATDGVHHPICRRVLSQFAAAAPRGLSRQIAFAPHKAA